MKLMNKINTLFLIKYFFKEDTLNLGNINSEICKVLKNQEPARCDELSFINLACTPGWVYITKMLNDNKSIEKLKILIKFSYENKTELIKLFTEIFKEISLNDLVELGYNDNPFEPFKRLDEKYSKFSSIFSKFSELLISLEQSLFTAYIKNKQNQFISSFEDDLIFKRHVLEFLFSFFHTFRNGKSQYSKFRILNKKIRPTLINSMWDIFFVKFIVLINENYKCSQPHVDFTINLDEFIAVRCQNVEFLTQNIVFSLLNNGEDLFNTTFDAFIDELKLMFFNKKICRKFKRNKKKFIYLYQLIDGSSD